MDKHRNGRNVLFTAYDSVVGAMLRAGCIALYEEMKAEGEDGKSRFAPIAKALVGCSDALHEIGFRVFPRMIALDTERGARLEPVEFAVERLLGSFRVDENDSEERLQKVADAWFVAARDMSKTGLVPDKLAASHARRFLARSNDAQFRASFSQWCERLGWISAEVRDQYADEFDEATQAQAKQAG